MKVLVGALNQEQALVGAFSVIVKIGCGTDGALHSTNLNNLLSTWNNWWTGGGGQPAGAAVQNCMQLRWSGGMWDDVSCTGTKNYYVCKK